MLPGARQQTKKAVREQQDLLAEFEKLADELNRVLANLEGSTLLKRQIPKRLLLPACFAPGTQWPGKACRE